MTGLTMEGMVFLIQSRDLKDRAVEDTGGRGDAKENTLGVVMRAGMTDEELLPLLHLLTPENEQEKFALVHAGICDSLTGLEFVENIKLAMAFEEHKVKFMIGGQLQADLGDHVKVHGFKITRKKTGVQVDFTCFGAFPKAAQEWILSHPKDSVAVWVSPPDWEDSPLGKAAADNDTHPDPDSENDETE